jgi:hypothetical protein
MKVIIFIFLFFTLFATKSTEDWVMYPNPARDYFCIEVSEGTLPAYVRVYDMKGRLVLNKYIGEEMMFARIQINFRPGTYIVYLTDK